MKEDKKKVFIKNDNGVALEGEMLPVYVSAKDQKWRSLTFGCTAKGFSSVIRRMAEQEGVSYDEIERRCQPTKEQTDKREKERQEAHAAAEKRLGMVRSAYWDGSDKSEFYGLHDAIVSVLDVTPTTEQIRSVFNILPAEIISGAIQWGLSDTVVRGNAYEFIQENESKVRTVMSI